MTHILEETICSQTNKHFPLAKVRKRSSESPWITRNIRKLWKRKIRLYKEKGKNQALWGTERKLQEKIEAAKSGFVDLLLEEGKLGRSFYAATKKVAACTTSPQWSVGDLFPRQGPLGCLRGGPSIILYYCLCPGCAYACARMFSGWAWPFFLKWNFQSPQRCQEN